MKKILKTTFIFYILFLSNALFAQKKYTDIINSQDIKLIEEFMKTTHPEDPRKPILQRRLVKLKNESWAKPGSGPAMQPRYIIEEKKIILKDNNFANEKDAQDYINLMSEDSKEHKEKTVILLNQIFNNDISNDKTVLLIKNNTNCNIVLRIKGGESYDLPVPAHEENSIVIKKGGYVLNGSLCDSQYVSYKNLQENQLLVLNKKELK